MSKQLMTALAAVLFGLVLLVSAPAAAQAPHGFDFVELDEAELFFEENTTDGDMGIHFKVDGEGWRRIFLIDPDWRPLLNAGIKGSLREIGLTELFSESSEPGYDEMPREEFLALFDEGTYRFFAQSIEGDWLYGETELTKDIPAGPVVTWPEEDAEVPADEDLVVQWETVDPPSPGESEIEFYEVVVEKDEDEEMLRVFTVHMLPEDTSVRCPAEFLEAGKEYKVEIVVQESSGNRAAAEVPFVTAEDNEFGVID